MMAASRAVPWELLGKKKGCYSVGYLAGLWAVSSVVVLAVCLAGLSGLQPI